MSQPEKPFHLMTPAERTALRIAQNRAIAERVAEKQLEEQRAGRGTTARSTTRKASAPKAAGERVKPQPPPQGSTNEFTRSTPEDRAKQGGFVRRTVQS